MHHEIDSDQLEIILENIELLLNNNINFNEFEDIIFEFNMFNDKILEEIKFLTTKLLLPIKFIKKGKFIVVTGTDKSGKETQTFNPKNISGVTSIYDYLTNLGYNVMKIFLPSYNTMPGSLIGSYIKRPESEIKIKGNLSKNVAWLLWVLDRAQYNEKISDWLKKSKKNIVLSKRWCETNIAYQLPMGISLERLLNAEKNIIKQDNTFVINVNINEIMRRITLFDEKPDIYEKKDFLYEVNNIYLNLGSYYKYGKIVHVDGNNSVNETNKQILTILETLF